MLAPQLFYLRTILKETGLKKKRESNENTQAQCDFGYYGIDAATAFWRISCTQALCKAALKSSPPSLLYWNKNLRSVCSFTFCFAKKSHVEYKVRSCENTLFLIRFSRAVHCMNTYCSVESRFSPVEVELRLCGLRKMGMTIYFIMIILHLRANKSWALFFQFVVLDFSNDFYFHDFHVMKVRRHDLCRL